MTHPPPGPRATRREWIGLAVIALPCLVYAMDLTVLNLALPALSAELKPSSAQLLWIVDIYGFLVAGFLITMGTLGDRLGRRKLMLIGAAAFGLASAAAAFARSAEMLIFWRAVLGIAGATVAPSTMSLIRNMFHDEQQRRFAIGVWIASYSVGGAIGPLVGGVLLQFFHWSAVFWLAVPVMGLLLLLGPALLPEYRDRQAGRIDAASVVLSLGAVLATIYGLKQTAEHGPSLVPLGIAALGIALAITFVRRQRRLAYPLLDLALFRTPTFGAAIAAYALSCLAMMGVYIFITQYLQGVLGLTPLEAGLVTLPWGIGFVAGSLLAPKLAQRVPPLAILVWGLVAGAIGMLLLVPADGRFALPLMIASMVVMSLGMAPVFTIGNELIITAAPPQRAGAASALSETSAEFSGALGIAVFGSVGMALYRGRLAAAMPAGLPADAERAAAATLGGALAAADAAAGPAGAALQAAARAAFGDALQLTAALGTVVVIVAAVLAARIGRERVVAQGA
ncbi:MFS transporter [Aquincola sp. S2]|uniref:MFS transporter n=1 Tax=Pseudaquabacterium terrae TaxID=2732868 RepID=A0ABX2EEI1_9BURK|nr:MFS transporter [Aquabacterium terrae]NRF67022.1 MFS transporter [Aquabacterium terrae]